MLSPRLLSSFSRALRRPVCRRVSQALPTCVRQTGKASSLLSRGLSTPLPAAVDGSDSSTYEHNFDEVEIGLMLKAEEDRLASYNGVQVISSTGVRAVEFCRPDKGNYLTTSVLENLIQKIDNFESNWVANAIFLGSQSMFFFSAGVHPSDFLDEDKEGQALDKAIQKCASRVFDFPEHMISLYGGYITGTPFGMLLGSHYRLGTPSLLLCVDEPSRGQIPLGGLALQFARDCTISPTVLKYLAFSGATLHSNELYELGVLTHLTDHKPHTGMQFGDTILLNDTKAVQPAHGEPEYLKYMIDDMDINADFEDVHSHEAWDKYLTVPVTVPEEDPLEPTNIKVIFEEMESCFREGMSLEESVSAVLEIRDKRTSGEDNVWVDNALRHMAQCCPLALKCWFKLVDESHKMMETRRGMLVDSSSHSAEDCQHYLKRCHADMLALEVNINEALRQHQKEGKWQNQNAAPKESFDLSYYEDDPIEEIDLLEKKTLKQLEEERQRVAAARSEAEKKLDSEIQSFQAALKTISNAQVDAIFASSSQE